MPIRDGLGRLRSARRDETVSEVARSEELRGFLSRCERATERPTVLLAIDRFGWAFHADAEGLVKHLSNEFALTIVRHKELATNTRH